MSLLADIIVSKVRVKLLEIFLSHPKDIYYVRQLVRETSEEINAVRRELANLEGKGLVKKEARANRIYYEFRKDYPLYSDLLTMVAKTTGLGQEIIKNKNKIGNIKWAMLSGKFIRGKKHDQQDVDLLVVGEIVLPQLAAIVRDYEGKIKREINYTAMSKEEFDFRKKRRDPFIHDILLKSRVMLIGDEEELVA